MDETPPDDRRLSVDRRIPRERRSGRDRRAGSPLSAPVSGERRRQDRRTGLERRFALPLAQQLRTVIDLLFLVDPARLGDEDRRRFDAAILRLRFTLDRIEDTDA